MFYLLTFLDNFTKITIINQFLSVCVEHVLFNHWDFFHLGGTNVIHAVYHMICARHSIRALYVAYS